MFLIDYFDMLESSSDNRTKGFLLRWSKETDHEEYEQSSPDYSNYLKYTNWLSVLNSHKINPYFFAK